MAIVVYGYDPDEKPPMMRLGLATSTDGLSWTRFGSEPLLKDLWVEDMMVVEHNNQLWMFAEGLNDQAQLLTSTDGVHWSKKVHSMFASRMAHQSPRAVWNSGGLSEGCVWHLYYETP